tara:strand:- start:306 stop:518 length:213 start_codon:yes stop_codon:yes gene_type:complete
MAFVSKSFIGDATALSNTESDGRGIDSLSKQVEDYLTSLTPAGSAGAREIKVTSSSLAGDRVFILVTVET